MLRLRKIIRENIEFFQNAESIKNRIDPIKDFKCVNFTGSQWDYEKVTNGESYYLHVRINNENNKWTFEIDVHWNDISSQNTSNKGRDYKLSLGPYNSLDEMADDVSKKLKNNPIMSPRVYEDDYDNSMDTEIFKLIKKLRDMGPQINSVARKYNTFSDLCEIYDETIEMGDDELMDYIKSEYPTSSDKQTCTLTLQKMNKIGFYKNMKNIAS